ncbi:serine/threonine protein kinase [Paenibacillus xylaniclasticus]|uniref:serine/threonine protein kinase n=1 Tax=Paenibacillus xylaniclasticus TaxID=588083 RepID=UPI00174FBF3E|nr:MULTISPECIES: protein kinase family protein [Paenibacillus]GFN31463.1 putative serine/threonine-protein kinase YbdM [Paenibacillus curdlanolyticus]
MVRAWWQRFRHNWMDYPLRQGTVRAGRYRIEQSLGMGSYGQAYRCTDLAAGTPVLMKRGKPTKRSIGHQMLKRESELMRKLHHPQIPQWLNEVNHRSETLLVMDFIEGDNLEHAIMELGRTYTEREALLIVSQVLRPLKYLHEEGYVHRDVRTPNIIQNGDSVWLIDFGLACRISEEHPDEWRRTWLADQTDEEHEEGQDWHADSWGEVKQRMRKPEPASDLYGLGHVFLFLMYAGYVPQEGQEELGWEEELSLHPAVKCFISDLLARKWETAAQCEQELERVWRALS